MKFLLLTSQALAATNVWSEDLYCDYNQIKIEQFETTDKTYSYYKCHQWCLEVDKQNGPYYDQGSDMCCDFEKWSDGSFNCYLYAGGEQLTQNKEDYPNDKFQSIVFPHL